MPRRSRLPLLLAIGLLCCPTIAWAAPPLATLTLTLQYGFDAPAIAAEGGLAQLSLAATANSSPAGEPALPVKTARVLLPPGMVVTGIELSGELRDSIILRSPLAPVRAPVPVSEPAAVTHPIEFGSTYGQEGPYPATLLGQTSLQRWRGHDILYVSLHPLRYWPSQRRLDSYRSLTLTVTLAPAPNMAFVADQGADTLAQLAAIVDNPNAVQAVAAFNAARSAARTAGRSAAWSTGLLDGSSPCAHVIITSPALRDAPPPDNLQALAAHRTAQGLPSCLITTDWIAANYAGQRPDGASDLQTAIRNFIRDAYASWDARYVLLAGDADDVASGGEAEPPIVPVRGLAVTAGSYRDDSIPSDLYYACLDGSFDRDADGLYGEPTDGEDGGLVDLLAEVYVGRIAVDSATEVANVVRKTIAYELSTDAYLDRVLLVGENLGWPSPWGGDRKDAVLLGSSALGFRTIGFGDSPMADIWRVQTLYDRDEPDHYWEPQQLLSLLADPIHLLNHMGHGSATRLMRLTSDVADSQLRPAPGFVGYSQACDAGAFDNQLSGGSPVADCVVEHLTTGPNGAVAFVANSRYGWGDDTVPDLGTSQYYDREFWDALLGEGLTALGEVHQDAKDDVFALLGPAGMDGYFRWVAYGLNLFGDPALRVRTPNGQAGARLAAVDDGQTPPAQGNSDGLVQAGETIALTGEVWNGAVLPLTSASLQISSADACVTVLSPPVALHGLRPGTVAAAQEPIVIAIDDGCPDGHDAQLTLTTNAMFDGQPRSWISTETLTIHNAARTDVAVAPARLIAALPPGRATTLPLTIINTGTEVLIVDLYASGESVSALATQPLADYTLLVVASASLDRIKPLLTALGEMDDIAYALWDGAQGAPTVEDLAIYDVVLAANSAYWQTANIDADELGDALADYVDRGGKVVETQLAPQNGFWGLTGRFAAQSYGPITLSTGYAQGDLPVAVVDAAHPLVAGLTEPLTTTYRLDVAARPGAVVPAVYASTSIPFVAANANVVFINQQFLASAWGEGDRAPLLNNAVHWLCGERDPWLTIAPSHVEIPPGDAFEATVGFDSAHARLSTVLEGVIVLKSNSPDQPTLTIPAELAVIADASLARLGGVARSVRTGLPLTDAAVQAQAAGGDPRVRVTASDGAFRFWLTPTDYTLTASLPGYLTVQDNITLAPQDRAQHDMTMVRDAPWLRADSTVRSGAVPLGRALEHAFVFHNDGVQPLVLELLGMDNSPAADLPAGWATLNRAELTIAPGAQDTLLVTLDTAGFGEAQLNGIVLRFSSNDPDMPTVALHAEVAATVPAGYGLLAGTVTSLRTGEPLAANVTVRQGATVALAHATSADGAFGPWALPAGEWALDVSSEGYLDASLDVTVTAGQPQSVDAALLLDAPWLRLTPDRLVVEDHGAHPVTLEAAVANTGSQPLHYALVTDALPDWIGITPGSGLVLAGAQEAFAVHVDAAAAPPGWTVLSLSITSDDPHQLPAALRIYVRHGQVCLLPALAKP